MSKMTHGANELAFWLKTEGRKQKWLAEICGVDRATVSQWVRGKWVPQPAHRAKINEVTDGAVKEEHWK